MQGEELGPLFVRRCVGVDGRVGVGARCGGPIRVSVHMCCVGGCVSIGCCRGGVLLLPLVSGVESLDCVAGGGRLVWFWCCQLCRGSSG